MKKSLAIVIMCCAFAFALGLAACGGSSSGSAASSASGSASSASASTASGSSEVSSSSSSASSAAVTVDVQPEYLDTDGGITLAAVRDLTGPELQALLQQQGYEWSSLTYENKATEDKVYICDVKDKTVKEDGYQSATGKGDLAKGYVKIVTHAYTLETTADLETVRDAIAPGYTVEDSWVVGGGAYYYNVVTDASGARAILCVIASDVNEAYVEFETDEYLVAKGDGGVDGVIALWNS